MDEDEKTVRMEDEAGDCIDSDLAWGVVVAFSFWK